MGDQLCMERLWLFSNPKAKGGKNKPGGTDQGGVVCSEPKNHEGNHAVTTEGWDEDSRQSMVVRIIWTRRG